MTTKQITMGMRPDTVAEVDELQSLLNATNRADVVGQAVHVMYLVAKAIRSGGRVVIEDAEGETSALRIPSLEG